MPKTAAEACRLLEWFRDSARLDNASRTEPGSVGGVDGRTQQWAQRPMDVSVTRSRLVRACRANCGFAADLAVPGNCLIRKLQAIQPGRFFCCDGVCPIKMVDNRIGG
jgi:hypothetical protein